MNETIKVIKDKLDFKGWLLDWIFNETSKEKNNG